MPFRPNDVGGGAPSSGMASPYDEELQFELADLDLGDETSRPPQPYRNAWVAASPAGMVRPQRGGPGRSSALSAGLASYGTNSPNRDTSRLGMDESTPTGAFGGGHGSSSLMSVPELSLPHSFSGTSPTNPSMFRHGLPIPSSNLSNNSHFAHPRSLSNSYPHPEAPSSPIAISIDRSLRSTSSASSHHSHPHPASQLSTSHPHHYPTPQSWTESYQSSFAPSSYSSDDGSLMSTSLGGLNNGLGISQSLPGRAGYAYGSGGGGGLGLGLSAGKSAVQGTGTSLLSGSLNQASLKSFGSSLSVKLGGAGGRPPAGILATGMEATVGKDGCPILKLPRGPFWGADGEMSVPHRLWKKGGPEKADNRHFMVMSYNVLAPMYCTDSRYHMSDPKFLDWEHRRTKILDEIAFYSPDFVCLQELPPSDFKDMFLPELQKLGYDGHFQQKKREHAADGCAIFFLESRFSLMAVQAFAYNDQIPNDPSTDLHQRVGPFPNVALVCVFQNRQARSLKVRVVNTHLHWDPAFADTKLLQAAILMEWLERTHRDIPTVIAADLNSRAGEAVVDFLVRGKVAPGPLFGDRDFGRFSAALTTSRPGMYGGASGIPPGSSLPNHSSSALEGKMNGSSGSLPSSGMVPLPLLRHGTKLASAYDRKDLPYTNKTPDFEGSIDHILYTSGTLSIRDVLADFDPSVQQQQQPQQPLEPPRTPPPPPPTGEPSHMMSSDATPTRNIPHTSSSASDLTVVDPSNKENEGAPQTAVTTKGDLLTQISPEPVKIRHSAPSLAPIDTHAEKASLSDDPGSPTSPTSPADTTTPNPAGKSASGFAGYLSHVRSLPTEHIPSDHLPLVAWLKWKTVPVGTGPITSGSLGGGGNGVSDRSRTRGGRRGGGGAAVAAAAAAVNNNSSATTNNNASSSASILSTSAPVKISLGSLVSGLSKTSTGATSTTAHPSTPSNFSVIILDIFV
ncbi:Glucose-repressible alcohol dehydrogenase transcriptional effector [Chytridiales sp. JEL 0842]|nr:Glucose-repressible alcohol dehydrogenase transcriptional effector [Chytridiales sp. JEL 0842]